MKFHFKQPANGFQQRVMAEAENVSAGQNSCPGPKEKFCECRVPKHVTLAQEWSAPDMILSLQASLYHQWQWCYWDLYMRNLKPSPRGAVDSNSGMWDFKQDFCMEEWETTNVVGVNDLILRKSPLAGQEAPLPFGPPQSESAATTSPVQNTSEEPRSASESIGLERVAPRHTYRGRFPGETHDNEDRYGMRSAWEFLKLFGALIFLGCRLQVVLVVMGIYAVYKYGEGVFDFRNNDRGRPLDQLLRELRQDYLVREEAQVSGQFAESARQENEHPQETSQHEPQGAEQDGQETVSARQQAAEPQPPTVLGPASETSGRNDSATAQQPEEVVYAFWQKFLYQLVVMFVFTLMPWWTPNPRLINFS